MPPAHLVVVVIDDAEPGPAEHDGNRWWRYVTEVLDHARLPHADVTSIEPATLTDTAILVFAAPPRLDAATQATVEAWVRAGGAVLTVGGAGDLTGLAGVRDTEPLDHEHVRLAESLVWTACPDVALHAIGGVRLAVPEVVDAPADEPEQVEVLARWTGDAPAITARRVGAGVTVTCGVDLWQSIVRIQQGYPVTVDAKPAPDGTAPLDDGLLKCDDGQALSFDEDRALPPGEPALSEPFEHTFPPARSAPMFHRPHADWWRSTFLQLLWWAADQVEVAVPWLHYWPAGVPAVAHLSHDSDLNEPEHGRTALEVFAEADVRVTWCQAFPGGYGPDVYAATTAAGHEHALHYNAMHDADISTWGWPQLRAQYAWAQAVTGVERIVSNKNHYTRWEGWDEFYRWCERLGIQIDQSRGPSKQGGIGFPFGTAHVAFPMAAAEHDNRYLDVLMLPLHTQDLALAAHESVRDVILDQAADQHGVAHFLFHGPHLHLRPRTRQACLDLVAEARRRGMPWWTSAQINEWERLRREVEVSVRRTSGGWEVRASTARQVPAASILLALPTTDAVRVTEGVARVGTARRHGRDFVELRVDLPAGTSSWTLAPA